MFLSYFVLAASEKKRSKNQVDFQIFKVWIIFIAQYINTAIMLILPFNGFVQEITRIKENDNKNIFVGPFDEFNSRWFLILGSSLVFTILVQIITPHLGVLIRYCMVLLKRWRDRRFTMN